MMRPAVRRAHLVQTALLSVVFILCLLLGAAAADAEEGLASCAEAFPGNDVSKAPRRKAQAGGGAAGDAVALCYRLGANVFFAVEYNTKRLMADWVAHRLDDRFGADGCGSIPRNDMKCYFGADDLEGCLGAKNKPGDPFHEDVTLKALKKPRLGTGAFGSTGHDRGHLAPNQSFSWHICGAYQTFTMANMAPQLAKLNRGLWADLEEQVLFWAVTEGPVYVVTGTMFGTFPADKFNVIKSGGVDKTTIVPPGEKLKPEAGGAPGQVVKPTGFYKVIFRPGRGGDGDRAVAFLVPHTRTEMTARYRDFIARVDVVESAAGFSFAVPDALKGAGGQEWWLERLVPGNWQLRAKTCPAGSPREGWQPELPKAERVAACRVSAAGTAATESDRADRPTSEKTPARSAEDNRQAGDAANRILLEEVRASLSEHKKASDALAARIDRDAAKKNDSRDKLLEIVANGGLAVAAIFFGFFGFLMGALPGAADLRVRKIYRNAARTTGTGVLASLGASILAMAALWSGRPFLIWLTVALAVSAALLIITVTLYFLAQLRRP